jgi:hypothetical protein
MSKSKVRRTGRRIESNMRRLLIAGLALAALAAPSVAQDTPFAQPVRPSDGGPSYPPAPRLADIMAFIQFRYPKLWFAGQSKNYPLAGYELARIRDGLGDAAWHYANIPIEAVMMVAKPLDDLRHAIDAKDHAKFQRGFRDLTHACNGCHEKAQLGFIVVRPPESAAFSDQDFTPAKK